MIIETLFQLLLLHTPDDRVIALNPDAIVSIREPKASEGHFPSNTHCIINTSDGKFVLVREDCNSVRGAMKNETH